MVSCCTNSDTADDNRYKVASLLRHGQHTCAALQADWDDSFYWSDNLPKWCFSSMYLYNTVWVPRECESLTMDLMLPHLEPIGDGDCLQWRSQAPQTIKSYSPQKIISYLAARDKPKGAVLKGCRTITTCGFSHCHNPDHIEVFQFSL